MNPSASVPIAMIISASSSLVMPQILTNMTSTSTPSQTSPQRLHRRDRVAGRNQCLADEDGVKSRLPQSCGVRGVAHAGLRDTEHIVWHCLAHSYRPIGVNNEGSEVALVDTDERRSGVQRTS